MVQGVTIDDWNSCKGDKTLRLDYPLNENSFVMDVGSFKGEWGAAIHQKYNCTVWAFEPVNKFFYITIEKFKSIKATKGKIKVFNFAMGRNDSKKFININGKAGDGSSFFKSEEKEVEEVHIKSISCFIKENNIRSIDLMKLNVEGSEYDILKDIIENDIQVLIKNLQVQFHKGVDEYLKRMEDIRSCLSKTHYLTYYFPMIWENWRINEDS